MTIFRWLVLTLLLLGIQAIATVISLGRLQVWARNSFRLGYFSRHSDLDLTVFSFSETSLSVARALARIYSRLGAGEATVLCATDLAFAGSAPLLELERDPGLLSLISQPPSATPGAPAKLVYLLRMAESDPYLYSSSEAPSRRKKWGFHLSRVGFPLAPEADLTRSIEQALRTLAPGEALPATIAELQHAAATARDYFLRPQFWVAHAIRYQLKPPRENPSSFLLSCQEEQLRWEAWGLLGQLRAGSITGAEAMGHLEALESLLNPARCSFVPLWRHLGALAKNANLE